MKYLLDTHIFLWALFDTNKLSKKVKSIIEEEKNEIYVSAISFWEISLKFSLKKLDLINYKPEDLLQFCEDSGFKTLNINPKLVLNSYKLENTGHKDPFDRLLIYQSIKENLILISKDSKLSLYEKHGLNYVN